MNIATLDQPSSRTRINSPTLFSDLTRGALRFGLRNQRVLVESAIFDDYAESEPTLGLNTAGLVLTVLSQHIALAPGGGRDESILVDLFRRDDGRLVEVELSLSRTRQQGQECLHLTMLNDREVE